MDPRSRQTLASALVAIGLLHAGTPYGHAHGGGGGHGGRGGASRGGGVGYQYAGPRHGSSLRGYGRGYGADPAQAAASSIGWPSFPEDLPLVKLHHFLLQHRPRWLSRG